MALTGQHDRSLDTKQRLAIPKSFKEEFGSHNIESLYIAKGFDRCLELYSTEEFQLYSERLRERATSQEEFLRFERLFFSSAERVNLDSQSRIRIPERLIQAANLQKDVVLIGVRNRVEIWDAEEWKTFQNQYIAQFDRLARDALASDK